MSNSDYYNETLPTNKANRNPSKILNHSCSTSTVSTSPSPYYSNNNTHLNGLDWFSQYQDSLQTDSYIDMLTTSGEDWLDSYTFTNDDSNSEKNHESSNKLGDNPQRRTFTAASHSENQPTMVRKSKSLRESSKHKLRSPPPPPPKARKSGFVEDLPSLPDKRHSMQYKKKPFVQSKNSDESLSPISENQPRQTVSSSIINHNRRSQNMTSVLSDYQGYSRQNKHRSFTYSPPPPTASGLNTVEVPAVPPVPPMPKLQPSTSTKLKKKKSDLSSKSNSSSSRPTSNTSNISNYKFNEPIPNIHDIPYKHKLQKELGAVITDSKFASPSFTPSIVNSSATDVTSNYTLNLTNDLAQIEQDIKALELEREIHSKKQKGQLKQAEAPLRTIGRKRGKTLPGSLATPPPIPAATLPPMTLNPIQMTIPNNMQKKPSTTAPIKLQPSTSTTTTKSSKFRLSLLSSVDNNTNQKHSEKKPSLQQQKRKSHIPMPSQNTEKEKVKRTTSLKQPAARDNPKPKVEAPRGSHHHHHTRKKSVPSEETHGRSPKSVQTTLKYYAPYLSDYERQIEIHDYQHIYFVGPHAKKRGNNATSEAFNFGYDDERGDYKIVIQDHLAYRYEVIEVLGRGSFGQVVKCFDHKTSQMVAIKLIRNKKRFHAQAMTEVNILKKLVTWDPEDHCNTIKMSDHFYFRNHLCIAFECLCMNLYEFIKSNNFQGFSIGLIKRITYQIIQSLLLLAEHDIIHCDLKPENIMLKHPGKSSIKVIDFGSSCLESERVYTYIQSRFYRSPEVILGISYHKAIDMWSLGCIIAELYTGIPIFPGENEQEQLGCIMEVMGIPDRHIIEQCSRRKLFFDSIGNPRIMANSKGKKRIPGTKSLFQVLKCHDIVFIDFIERCLRWDPARRMTPSEALQHEWIAGSSFPATPKSATFLSSSAIASAYN